LPTVSELVVVLLSLYEHNADYAVAKVLRQSSDGNSVQHQLHLFSKSTTGSWTPQTGKGSKKSFPSSKILLAGIHLTKKTSKISKRDLGKLKPVLQSL